MRRDITSSFGSASGTADGVPATIELTLLDTGNDSAPLSGAAVYVWHCDREGRYSLYSDGATDANYLRGVQVSDADGVGHVRNDLPRLLLRPVAPHSLRGVLEPRRCNEWR